MTVYDFAVLARLVFVPTQQQVQRRLNEYWYWFGLLLFLYISVDMALTMWAASAVGAEGEANPLMRWALSEGPAMLVLLNTVIATAGIFFQRLLHGLLRSTDSDQQPLFALAIEFWLGIFIAGALLLAANNLSIIFFGENKLGPGFDRSVEAAGTVGSDLVGLGTALVIDMVPGLLAEAAAAIPRLVTTALQALPALA
jgi:hypothetical protein